MPDTSDTSATRVTRMQHECDTNDTSETQAQHECGTSAIWVKNFDFENDTGKNIFSHRYTYYMASERLQGEEQSHTKN